MAEKKRKVRVTKKKDQPKADAPAADNKKAGAPKASDEFKYTIADLAKSLGIKEASARIKLRKAEVPKAGRAYGWNNKTDFEKVVKQLTPAKE